MSAKQPTDYIRAYQLARKLALKRLKRIKELEETVIILGREVSRYMNIERQQLSGKTSDRWDVAVIK